MLLQRYSASQTILFGRLRRPTFRRAVVSVATFRDAYSVRNGATEAPNPSCGDQVHVTIVGGGAAGLTAAFFAAEHGAKVTVLERTREAGKKILMSGGSRCNVLPLEVDLQTDYHSESSASAVRAVFASWNLELCKAWLEDPYWGIGLDLQLEEETKKYFPTSNSSKEVRDRLVAACLARGVEFRYNASVEGLRPLPPPPAEAAAAAAAPPAAEPVARAAEAPTTAEAGQAATPAPTPQTADQSNLSAGSATAASSEELRGDPAAESNGEGSSGGDADRRASGAAAETSGAGGRGGAGKRKGSRNARARAAAAAAEVEAAAAAAAAGQRPVVTAAAPTRWLCRLKDGTEHVTDKLIIATGGLSFPAVGTDGTGHRLLRALGHTLHEPYAALTPLTGPHPAGEQLAGVSMYGIELSVQVPEAKRAKVSERTALLFTHRGYSGPAVLDLSHFAVKALTRGSRGPPAPPQPSPQQQQQPRHGEAGAGAGGGSGGDSGGYVGKGLPSLLVNWTHEPAAVWDERLKAGGTALVTTLVQRHGLRERLAEALVSELGLAGRRVCDLKKAERTALVAALTSYELPYSGHEGYKKAEVTGGGVRLEELDCATMESRLLPNLFICGECVDVFGRIGGFNFYWAWVSGRLAGIGAAQGGVNPPGARKAERRRKTGGAAAAAAGVAA